MNFSNRLKKLRTQKGLTQQQISDYLNIPRTTYSGWERGAQEPNFTMISTLAELFNVSIDYLLGETDIKNKPDDILKGEYHKDFENVDEALKFILEDNTVMAFGGFDTNKLTDDEIIEFANALKNQIELLGLKYKR